MNHLHHTSHTLRQSIESVHISLPRFRQIVISIGDVRVSRAFTTTSHSPPPTPTKAAQSAQSKKSPLSSLDIRLTSIQQRIVLFIFQSFELKIQRLTVLIGVNEHTMFSVNLASGFAITNKESKQSTIDLSGKTITRAKPMASLSLISKTIEMDVYETQQSTVRAMHAIISTKNSIHLVSMSPFEIDYSFRILSVNFKVDVQQLSKALKRKPRSRLIRTASSVKEIIVPPKDDDEKHFLELPFDVIPFHGLIQIEDANLHLTDERKPDSALSISLKNASFATVQQRKDQFAAYVRVNEFVIASSDIPGFRLGRFEVDAAANIGNRAVTSINFVGLCDAIEVKFLTAAPPSYLDALRWLVYLRTLLNTAL